MRLSLVLVLVLCVSSASARDREIGISCDDLTAAGAGFLHQNADEVVQARAEIKAALRALDASDAASANVRIEWDRRSYEMLWHEYEKLRNERQP